MTVTRTFDILDQLMQKYPKEDILSRKVSGKWIKFSHSDYYNNSHLMAYAFLNLGFKREDKIIAISANRPEWNFTDMGATLAEMVFVPVYSTLSDDDYLHIIEHSDAKAIFLGSAQLAKKIAPLAKKIEQKVGQEIKLFTYDKIEGYTSIEELYQIGKESDSSIKNQIEENKKLIPDSTVATIIYTSGTTGTPKGVMLSHKNLVSNFIGTANQQIRDYRHKMLSFLPLCHIYERGMNYNYQYLGISTYYAESLGTIASDLADSKADGFCSVPRVLEMMFTKLENAGKDLKGISKVIYKWAFTIATKYDYTKKGVYHKFRYWLADKLVYSKWREKLGGKEMLIVSGGSSIQAKIIRLFTAAKMYIFEGYGMTETSPVIAVNNPKEMIIKIGTAGKAMEGTELRIAEDGEILTRGPHVMVGYYKDPEYTREIIDEDGWLHTGDIGVMEDEIFLRITDRKKEIFKLSNGKYIAPQVLENKLKESSYIENCMVIGENQKFASAIIIPDFSRLKSWAEKNKIEFTSNEELITHKLVEEKLNDQVNRVNRGLAPHEQIKRARLISDEWTPLNDMLSQTLKLKRFNVLKKYKTLISDIYHTDN